MPARSVLLTWRLRSTRLLAEAITVPVVGRCPAALVSASNHSSTNVTLSLYSAQSRLERWHTRASVGSVWDLGEVLGG